jgi:mannose/cellobiose epimerase-like protein (N-acyl-D-glucosamine 2-epimerase family)
MSQRERIRGLQSQLSGWLCDAAYPLWASNGIDRERGGFHEKLAQDGTPVICPRRSRVQPRQVYCYAMAPSLGWRGDAAALVHRGLDYWVSYYQRPDGLFRTLIGPDGKSLDERALTYDQAFGLLSFIVGACIGDSRGERAQRAFELRARVLMHLKRAGEGFESELPHKLPLQSNPHMHLFEATLAGCEASAETSQWKPIADELGELALARFIDAKTGALREFFDTDWNPAPGIEGRIVEPGHQFEWAWLLLRWAGDKHARARASALKLIEVGESHGVRNGLAINSMLDDFSVHDGGARMWPQTERLKAAALAARLTGEARYQDMAVSAAEGMLRYLATPIPGLWYDRITAEGVVVDEPAPASSFYHFVAAIAELSALARTV